MRVALIVCVAMLAGAVTAAAQETLSAQQLFEAGQYDQALQEIAKQREVGAAGPADAFLAGQILVKMGQNRPRKGGIRKADEGRRSRVAAHRRVCAGDPQRRQPARAPRGRKGGCGGAGSLPRVLSPRARESASRRLGWVRRCVPARRRTQPRFRLRALLRRALVFAHQARRPDLGTLRTLPQARPQGAGAGGYRNPDAHPQRPVERAAAQKVWPMAKYQRPNGSRLRRVSGMP